MVINYAFCKSLRLGSLALDIGTLRTLPPDMILVGYCFYSAS